MATIQRKPTRRVAIGRTSIGSESPIVVQSMCATKTQDVAATLSQIEQLRVAGAGIVRIAVDSDKDAEAVGQIRAETDANLSVDLQENYRLAKKVAPSVDKIRYNPGHLYHHEREKPVREKVAFLVETAANNDCAIRIGVNCGSIDPLRAEEFKDDPVGAMVASALEHSELVDSMGFDRYCVSLKDSDPANVVDGNIRFSDARPDVPLHLGVTEAGLPPDGIIKTRVAFEQLLSRGIGDTIRVSLTLPNPRKHEEVEVGHAILEDIAAGRFRSVPKFPDDRLNIISCPSCSRVENERFVELAEQVRDITEYAKDNAVTIAVMGCRVNGPGETDDADLGLWCAPEFVNFKKGEEKIGTFSYDDILPRLKVELDRIIEEKKLQNA